MYSGGVKETINHLVPFIKQKEDNNCVGFFNSSYDVIANRLNGTYHTIFIYGNRNEKILVAYIELFSSIKYIVLLNNAYDGCDLEYSYCFDLVNQREISCQYNPIYRSIAQQAFEANDLPYEEFTKCLIELMERILKKQESEHTSELIQKAIKSSLGKYSEGIEVTEDMRKELIEETTKQIIPWLIHRLNNSSK